MQVVSDERAARWGLHALEDPDRGFGVGRPIWRREAYGFVLSAAAVDDGELSDRFDLASFGKRSLVARDPDGSEHVLLTDGRHTLRLDIVSGSVCGGPVRLHYRIAGMRDAMLPLLTLRQLVALWRTGKFSRTLHPPQARVARWILLLRTLDALTAGVGQREIAEHLLDPDASGARWRISAPALRSRVQRLVRDARRMARGGYRELLRDRGSTGELPRD